MSSLGETLTLPNGEELKNRIVKSAMSEALGDEANDPTPDLINAFKLWGSGGAGLVITGNTPVDRMHLEHAGNFVLDPATDMARARALAAAAHEGGAKILAQLAHAGRQTPVAINEHPTSMSDVQLELSGYGRPVAATEDDLAEVIARFRQSAVLAQDAGFDGVEIHAAHGYLLSSALSPRINTRTDRWGGSLENRARLALEVVRAVRSAVQPRFIVAAKLNSSDFQKGGFDHADSVQVAALLANEGIDFIEISGGNFEAPTAYQHSAKSESTVAREAYFLDYATEIKAAVDIPLMVTGGFRSASVMNTALAAGRLDLIGIGRPFIIDPGFPSKLLSGAIDKAPSLEQDFPAAADLPRGAVLNWFCTQLALLGKTGQAEPSMSVIEGHERYLRQIELATERLLAQRSG